MGAAAVLRPTVVGAIRLAVRVVDSDIGRKPHLWGERGVRGQVLRWGERGERSGTERR